VAILAAWVVGLVGSNGAERRPRRSLMVCMYIRDYGCMDGGGRLIRCDVKVMGGKAKRGPT